MSEPTLPDAPDLDWLRKQAKRRLDALRQANPGARLADAQFDLAKELGFSSWRALKSHIDLLTVDGQLIEAARSGDVDTLAVLLDEHPEKLHLRMKPYEWSLLHLAASNGRLAAVDLLLQRGLDVNVREKGDDTCAMHWAAAQGHLDVVRRLADAGGDVVGRGDDHALEIIGWATCWEQCHGAVAEFLVNRGARHHVFSAISMTLAVRLQAQRSGGALRRDEQLGIAEPPRFIPGEAIGEPERTVLLVERENDAVRHALPQEQMLQSHALPVLVPDGVQQIVRNLFWF